MHRRSAQLICLTGLLLGLLACGGNNASQTGAAGTTGAAASAGAAGGAVAVEDARVRALIPGQNISVAYLTLYNRGAEPITLTGVEGDLSPRIEMHSIVRDGDMMRMRRQAELRIEAGASLDFEPGGLHLMLFDVQQVPERGELRFSTASGAIITAPYRRFELAKEAS